MLKAQLKNNYRINENRKRLSNDEVKGVMMHIDPPVLQQYNSINLSSTLRSHRINRKSTSFSASAGPQAYKKFKVKWENLLDQYIESKQKIKQKKGLINSSFQFLKLNKANRFRFIRLAKNEALPVDLSKITKRTQQITAEQQKSLRRLKTDYETSKCNQQQILSKSRESCIKKNGGQKDVNDKVLHYFIQNYFKNKQRKSFRENNKTQLTNPLRNIYFTKSIARTNTN